MVNQQVAMTTNPFGPGPSIRPEPMKKIVFYGPPPVTRASS